MSIETIEGGFAYREAQSAAVPFAGLVEPVQFVAEGIIAAVATMAGAFATAGDSVAAVGAANRRRRERKQAMRELAHLPNSTLKDIGISRPGIRAAVLDVENNIDPRGR